MCMCVRARVCVCECVRVCVCRERDRDRDRDRERKREFFTRNKLTPLCMCVFGYVKEVLAQAWGQRAMEDGR